MIWTSLTFATACITLALALYATRSLRDLRTTFVILAIWARYVLQAFPDYTTPSLVAGFSLIALSSIGVAGLGLALVPPRFYLQLRSRLLTLLPILLLTGVSGLINGEFVGLVKDMMKWLYFLAIVLLLYRAFLEHDADVILRGLFAAALTPIILQWLSVALGRGSADYDGTMSYVGGYGGQAGFSIVLFTLLCLGSLIKWRYAITSLLIIPFCVGGIFLANYRTTILATLPVIAVIVGGFLMRWTPRLLRPLTLVYLLAAGAGLGVLGFMFMPPRFLDILVVIQSASELIKSPLLYTEAEADLFSGRIHLWAQYISTWWEASTRVHLLGFGPEAWDGVQRLYAHNTFVSYLYEFGILGPFFLALFLGSQLALAAAATPPGRAAQLVAGLLGFVVLNLATMPLWLLEGLIVLAILCARSWASVEEKSVETARRTPVGARWRGPPSAAAGSRWAAAKRRSLAGR